jgi:hypothetical protein
MSSEPPASAGTSTNGTSASANGAVPPPTCERTRTERAEAIVDNVSHRIGSFASRFRSGVKRLISGFTDEVGNIWNEAQCVRRGEQSTPSNPPSPSDAPKE